MPKSEANQLGRTADNGKLGLLIGFWPKLDVVI